MKLDKSKRTLFAFLLLYIAIGLIAIVGFFLFGSKLTRSGRGNIEYNFFDDGNIGPDVDIASVNVIGDSGALVEAKPEAKPEPTVEKTPVKGKVQEAEVQKQYYSFTVITQISRLHVRKEPDINAKIINYFPKGAEGYVLEKGDEWSLVTDGTITGYSFNEYLDMTEISIDDLPDYFPEEYK